MRWDIITYQRNCRGEILLLSSGEGQQHKLGGQSVNAT